MKPGLRKLPELRQIEPSRGMHPCTGAAGLCHAAPPFFTQSGMPYICPLAYWKTYQILHRLQAVVCALLALHCVGPITLLGGAMPSRCQHAVTPIPKHLPLREHTGILSPPRYKMFPHAYVDRKDLLSAFGPQSVATPTRPWLRLGVPPDIAQSYPVRKRLKYMFVSGYKLVTL